MDQVKIGRFLKELRTEKELTQESLAAVAGCALLLFATFSLTDYLAVTKFNRVPRFCHRVSYNSENPNQLEYDTIFYTAVWENPGTEWERVYIK